MSTKPILFNTEMTRAILDGRKTQTRRAVKGFIPDNAQFGYTAFTPEGNISCRGVFANGYGEKFYKLPYHPGDILYVRETWTTLLGTYLYKADQKPNMKNPGKWRPSIHMPREAARIFLRVKDVRAERLREITYIDVWREGLLYKNESTDREVIERFSRLWDSTIKPADRERYGWEASPWVWVIAFERVEKPEEGTAWALI